MVNLRQALQSPREYAIPIAKQLSDLVQTSYYSGQSRGSSSTVQDYVADKKTTSNLGHPSSQPQLQHQLPPTIHVQPPPEVFLATTELDMGDQQDPIQQMDQQDFEQRHFSAPQMEWDASR